MSCALLFKYELEVRVRGITVGRPFYSLQQSSLPLSMNNLLIFVILGVDIISRHPQWYIRWPVDWFCCVPGLKHSYVVHGCHSLVIDKASETKNQFRVSITSEITKSWGIFTTSFCAALPSVFSSSSIAIFLVFQKRCLIFIHPFRLSSLLRGI